MGNTELQPRKEVSLYRDELFAFYKSTWSKRSRLLAVPSQATGGKTQASTFTILHGSKGSEIFVLPAQILNMLALLSLS